MTTSVLTEEFPIPNLTPQPASAVTIKSNVLESGMQSVSRDTTSAFVSFKFAVLGGSSAESKVSKGAAHFLSTAAFAGNNSSSGMKIVNDLESLGATFQSYSDKEKTVYDVKVLADKAEPVIATVLSAIASPPHASYILEELRGNAQLDYNRFAVDTSAQLRELVHEAAFGEASALGSSQFATNLKKLSLAETLQFRAANFVRGNVVVAANGISQDRLNGALNKYSSVIPAGKASAPASSAFVGGEVKVRTDLDGSSRLGLAFAVPAGDAGKAYSVLNALVSSKLAAQQLCCSAYIQSFSKGGLMGVEAATTQHLEAYVAELKNIATKCPDIEIIKQKLTLEHFLTLEGACSTSVLLNAHLRGQGPQSAGDMRGVTAAEVSAAAAAALKSAPAYAVLGATAGTPSYGALTNMMK